MSNKPLDTIDMHKLFEIDATPPVRTIFPLNNSTVTPVPTLIQLEVPDVFKVYVCPLKLTLTPLYFPTLQNPLP